MTQSIVWWRQLLPHPLVLLPLACLTPYPHHCGGTGSGMGGGVGGGMGGGVGGGMGNDGGSGRQQSSSKWRGAPASKANANGDGMDEDGEGPKIKN
jgi:hypothetical protein